MTSERVCVVTGASSGIGKETARELARQGARVGLVCRNPAKGDATLTELKESAPDATIDLLLADLSELAQVRTLAGELHDRYDHVDVLINNAGINAASQVFTSEGIDAMLATNYLAPFLLTNLLFDLLGAAPEGRVVNVASEAHRIASRIDVERLPEMPSYRGPAAPNRAYGLTKILLILFTQELARRLAASTVTANSVCPGLVATNLIGEGAFLTRAGELLQRTPLVRTAAQGAQMSVKLATDPAMGKVSGEFFTSTPAARLLPPMPVRRDVDLQRRLWEKTAEIVGLDQ